MIKVNDNKKIIIKVIAEHSNIKAISNHMEENNTVLIVCIVQMPSRAKK